MTGISMVFWIKRTLQEYRGVHAHSCVMGNQGKMEGNLKICIDLQKSNLRVQRNNTLNLECKEIRDQFLENIDIPIHFL